MAEASLADVAACTEATKTPAENYYARVGILQFAAAAELGPLSAVGAVVRALLNFDVVPVQQSLLRHFLSIIAAIEAKTPRWAQPVPTNNHRLLWSEIALVLAAFGAVRPAGPEALMRTRRVWQCGAGSTGILSE